MNVRWAHNPKVVGSNPTPATNKKGHSNRVAFFCMYGDWSQFLMVRSEVKLPACHGVAESEDGRQV